MYFGLWIKMYLKTFHSLQGSVRATVPSVPVRKAGHYRLTDPD